MQKSEAQKLIDILFDVALTIERANLADDEAKAAWVAQKLKGCGFYTMPVGSSWGVLVSESQYNYMHSNHKVSVDISLVMANRPE